MKTIFTSILTILIVLLFSFSASIAQPVNQNILLIDASVYFSNSTNVIFEWDPPIDGSIVSGYEIELECTDGTIFKKESLTNSVVFSYSKRQKMGHYLVYVRSFIESSNGRIYSNWISSENPTEAQIWIQGQPKKQGAWMLYWKAPLPILLDPLTGETTIP